MTMGIVRSFCPIRRYGFIRPLDGSKEVLVHVSALEKTGLSSLKDGVTVSYDLVSKFGKTSACNLRVVASEQMSESTQMLDRR